MKNYGPHQELLKKYGPVKKIWARLKKYGATRIVKKQYGLEALGQGMVRSLKLALEARIGAEVPEDHPVVPWLVRHAAQAVNRYRIGSDGLTRHRRLKGRDFNKEVAEFGESVWFLFLKSKGKNKMKSRWASGIWLGIRDESGEVIIGTDEGVIKCRTVGRKGTKEERLGIRPS